MRLRMASVGYGGQELVSRGGSPPFLAPPGPFWVGHQLSCSHLALLSCSPTLVTVDLMSRVMRANRLASTRTDLLVEEDACCGARLLHSNGRAATKEELEAPLQAERACCCCATDERMLLVGDGRTKGRMNNIGRLVGGSNQKPVHTTGLYWPQTWHRNRHPK